MAENPRLNPKLAAYFGVIQNAVSQRKNTSELYANLRAAFAESGQTFQGIPIGAVSTARGLAAQIRNTREAFTAAPGDSTIDASMVAQNWYSRPLSDQNILPSYDIRFQHTYISEGETFTEWRTVTNLDLAGFTKDELIAQLDEIAAVDFVAHYEGIQHVSVGAVEISAV